MTLDQTIEVPILGMDCAECTQHVQHAIAALPGVRAVDVLLAAEKAVVRLDPVRVDREAIARAVEGAGYRVSSDRQADAGDLRRSISRLLIVIIALVLAFVVFGELLGAFDWLTARLPWPVGLAAVLIGGFPVFRNVVRATLRRQVISHTLMTLGVIAAMRSASGSRRGGRRSSCAWATTLSASPPSAPAGR